MNQKSKYILLFLAMVAAIIFVVFSCGEKNDNKTQENDTNNSANAVIPITSSKKENEIIVGDGENSIVVEEGEEIIVGE